MHYSVMLQEAIDGLNIKEDGIYVDCTCGYAVNAAIKVRNDADCSDFDFLNFPTYKNGECCDSGITMKPNQTRREYRKNARWFLETFVAMTNAHKKGEVIYE